MPGGLLEDAADEGEPVGAAVERKLRLAAAFAVQSRHALRVDIGRIGDNQVVALVTERLEQVAAMQRHPFFKSVVGDIARGDFERASGNIYRIDPRMGKAPAREHGETA